MDSSKQLGTLLIFALVALVSSAMQPITAINGVSRGTCALHPTLHMHSEGYVIGCGA